MTEDILAAILVIVASFAGAVLTLLTLPGTWLSVLVAVGVAFWRPELISWWTMAWRAAWPCLPKLWSWWPVRRGQRGVEPASKGR